MSYELVHMWSGDQNQALLLIRTYCLALALASTLFCFLSSFFFVQYSSLQQNVN